MFRYRFRSHHVSTLIKFGYVPENTQAGTTQDTPLAAPASKCGTLINFVPAPSNHLQSSLSQMQMGDGRTSFM